MVVYGVPKCSSLFRRFEVLMPTLDSQGWIDFIGGSNGKTGCAFFVRNGILWVRKGKRYKRTELREDETIESARTLAERIARETRFWRGPALIGKGLPQE